MEENTYLGITLIRGFYVNGTSADPEGHGYLIREEFKIGPERRLGGSVG